jgi:energy-dependent translational throttle protein EttA
VREVVGEGVGDVQSLIDRFNAISDRFAEPMSDDEMNKLMEEQAKMQDKIDAVGGWELERKLEIAADSLRLPPWDALVGKLSGGEKRRVACAGCCCRSRTCCCSTSRPTISTRNRSRGSNISSRSISEHRHRGHSRPLFSRQRRRVDPGTRPRHGIPWQGNYSSWLEQKEQRLAQEERQQDALAKTLKRELEWVRTNPKARRRNPRRACSATRNSPRRNSRSATKPTRSTFPPGDRLGDLVIECKEHAQGLRRPSADRLVELQPAAGRHRRHHRPNGAGKTTLFRMLSGVEKPDAARSAWAPR